MSDLATRLLELGAYREGGLDAPARDLCRAAADALERLEARAIEAETVAKNWRYAFEERWGADLLVELVETRRQLAQVRTAWATCRRVDCCASLAPEEPEA